MRFGALEQGLAALNGGDPILEQRIDAELIACELLTREVRESAVQRFASYGGEVPERPTAQAVLTAMAITATLTSQPAAETAAFP